MWSDNEIIVDLLVFKHNSDKRKVLVLFDLLLLQSRYLYIVEVPDPVFYK